MAPRTLQSDQVLLSMATLLQLTLTPLKVVIGG